MEKAVRRCCSPRLSAARRAGRCNALPRRTDWPGQAGEATRLQLLWELLYYIILYYIILYYIILCYIILYYIILYYIILYYIILYYIILYYIILYYIILYYTILYYIILYYIILYYIILYYIILCYIIFYIIYHMYDTISYYATGPLSARCAEALAWSPSLQPLQARLPRTGLAEAMHQPACLGVPGPCTDPRRKDATELAVLQVLR